MSGRAKPNAAFGAGRSFTILDRVQTGFLGVRHKATGFISNPEPRTIGSHARGRQLAAGNFRFGGHLVQAPGLSIWELTPPDSLFETEMHGFTWLDDLAKVTDGTTRRLAQGWLNGWVAGYGQGRGPGWAPDLVGRRVIRWINHAVFLLNGQSVDNSRAYFAALTRQANFLGQRWSRALPGLPRFEALTGLLYAGVSLEGMERYLTPAMSAIARECAEQIDAGGGLPNRNPEHLMEVLIHLNWVRALLRDRDMPPLPALEEAVLRIRPTLLALTHADGRLARFHGGGRGQEGQLDHAFEGQQAGTPRNPAMGYSRLMAGRTTVIADTALPPDKPFSANAHASTLAFELCSGRNPVIVNCGSGAPFGADWRRAGRATPSHSTLAIHGVSSARLSSIEDGEFLVRPARTLKLRGLEGGVGFVASHDGYRDAYGLTHLRRLELTQDGRRLNGEDSLAPLNDRDKMRFERHMDRTILQGVAFAIRFHLHPDIEASIDMGGTAVSLTLKAREVWVFRFAGQAQLSVDPSVYLEKGRIKPRATKQIVLSSRLMEYAGQISWSLTRAQDVSRR